MNLRAIFHNVAVSLVTTWLSEPHRLDPEHKYVYPSDLYFDLGFPLVPEVGKCVKITLEIVDDPRLPKVQVESIPLPIVTL